MDIGLDIESHDLVIDHYDLVLVRDQDMVAQALRQNLRFFFGEWYLAVDEGLPYFQEIFVKGADILTAESYFKKAIIQTIGVRELLEFSFEYTSTIRRLIVMFSVSTIYGPLLHQEVEP